MPVVSSLLHFFAKPRLYTQLGMVSMFLCVVAWSFLVPVLVLFFSSPFRTSIFALFPAISTVCSTFERGSGAFRTTHSVLLGWTVN